jgi:hypothetical protein
LQQVAKGCLSYLMAQRSPGVEAANMAAMGADSRSLDRLYMAHLVTATLCLGLAPRSQVLKQLRIGSTFVKEPAEGSRYWVKLLADMSKNGKPTTFAIPPQLTAAFDYYLANVRPRLVQQQAEPHDYVFVKHNGSFPRSDYSNGAQPQRCAAASAWPASTASSLPFLTRWHSLVLCRCLPLHAGLGCGLWVWPEGKRFLGPLSDIHQVPSHQFTKTRIHQTPIHQNTNSPIHQFAKPPRHQDTKRGNSRITFHACTSPTPLLFCVRCQRVLREQH